ncbi:MAG TPA: hypothetical protein VIC05_06200 [Solirubrobacteraceae bacterium]
MLASLRYEDSTARLLSHYAHVIADTKRKSIFPSQQAIKSVRAAESPPANSNSTRSKGGQVLARWLYG